jgi:single-stranded DNA-specific DHH superfamily exonuclease
LAALGIIADVMDLRNFETKHILAKGFKNIKNPFIA